MAKDSDPGGLTGRLENALLQLNLENKQLDKAIRAVLHRSVDYGRAGRVLGENPTDDACQDYVEKVVAFYKEHHVFVICLEKREHDAWVKAIPNIRKWANAYLRNRNIDGPLKISIVEECVPNAVLAFLNAMYHYDTSFDSWFCVLVQNVCKKYIKDEVKSNRAMENKAQSLDKFQYVLEQIADKNNLNDQRTRELRSDLLEAVENLSSDARKQLIILYYFEGYSFAEISEIMTRSMAAVYKLHHDALNDLKDIFGDSWS